MLSTYFVKHNYSYTSYPSLYCLSEFVGWWMTKEFTKLDPLVIKIVDFAKNEARDWNVNPLHTTYTSG